MNEHPENSFMAPLPLTWRQKLARRLFPQSWCDFPEGPQNDWEAVEQIRTETYCKLSWMDRIRLLFTGKIRFTAKSTNDRKYGISVTNTVISVLPWNWLAEPEDRYTFNKKGEIQK